MAKGYKTGGRVKGTPNKTTGLLKDAILEAAELAGGHEGLVGYLKQQAIDNPGPFMGLLGKVLPVQVNAKVNTVAAHQMSDDELANIAGLGSEGIAPPQVHSGKPH